MTRENIIISTKTVALSETIAFPASLISNTSKGLTDTLRRPQILISRQRSLDEFSAMPINQNAFHELAKDINMVHDDLKTITFQLLTLFVFRKG